MLQTTWNILRPIFCYMYHNDCSIIEVSEVTKRALSLVTARCVSS
jgi:hypothetical protein